MAAVNLTSVAMETDMAFTTLSGIFPVLLYDDAATMLEWLCGAFGGEKRFVVPREDGGIVHAELFLAGGVVMIASASQKMEGGRQPAGEAKAFSCTYVAIDDVDGHCARARAKGARITSEPTDKPYGSRDYSCLDPEGRSWSFGTYNPLATDH